MVLIAGPSGIAAFAFFRFFLPGPEQRVHDQRLGAALLAFHAFVLCGLKCARMVRLWLALVKALGVNGDERSFFAPQGCLLP